MSTPTLYKFLDADLSPTHGIGSYADYLPADGKPGRLRRVDPPVVPCEHGFHATDQDHMVRWIAPRLFVVKLGKAHLQNAGDKYVSSSIRLVREITEWNERTQRIFAAKCAESVLDNFERQHPNDRRPRQALEAALAYADGLITVEALRAADSAAYSAADSAAYSAARSAADSAADSAARSAARSAAYLAAYWGFGKLLLEIVGEA